MKQNGENVLIKFDTYAEKEPDKQQNTMPLLKKWTEVFQMRKVICYLNTYQIKGRNNCCF